MRTLLLLFISCFTFLGVTGQTDSAFAYADYIFIHIDDTTQKHFPRKEDTRLYLGNKMSCYVPFKQMFAVKKMIDNPATAGSIIADLRKSMMSNSIYKESGDGKLFFVAPGGLNTYLIEEKMPEIKWTIMEDTRDIKGYTCQKATTEFRGRNYEAWFCPQLPYNNGPWKLGGLPGLILEAYDINKDVLFQFQSFQTGNDENFSSYTVPTNVEKITQKAYDRYISALNKDAQAMRGASNAGGGTVVGGVSRNNNGGPPKRIKIINNPLEKAAPNK